MKVEFEIPLLTQRVVAAMQEMNFAIAEADGKTAIVEPTDKGQLAECESIQKGRTIAEKLVSEWSHGWSEDPLKADATIDRMSLIASYKGNPDLYAYLKQNNESSANLIAVGATEAMAANIITVGSIAGAWPIQTI